MSTFKMPTAYHLSNAEWVRPIESLTSDGVRELQRLKAENTKLRELVTELHFLITDERVYVRYECESWERRLDAVEKGMRELGIEVNE